MTQLSNLPTSGQRFSKLEKYALAPFMANGQVCKTHDDLMGVLGIRTDSPDADISEADIDDLIKEESDRYVAYRYIELLFITRLLKVKIVSGEYGTSTLQHNGHEVDVLLINDENIYKNKKKEIEDPDYVGKDILVAYMPQTTITNMRSELEKIINKKNIGTKPPQHFVQESLADIPQEHTRTYEIQFASPKNTNSLATQLLQRWFSISHETARQIVKGKKSPRK